ncbi:MAG: fibronectin type III domain-containing protein, partial [Candidatus Moraniibacteriota bacterium]
RNIMAAVAIAAIVAMAFVYLTSGGNESRMTFAKGGMIAALIGLCIVLLAWVTVNFILTLPIFNTSTNLIRTGWDTVSCSTTSLSTGAVATTTPTPSTGGGGASGTGGGLGGGGDLVTLPRDTSGAVIVAPIASPASLGVTAPSASSAILSWGAVPGATGYEVERCTGLTCTVFTSLGTSNTTSFTDTTLTPGTSYSYHVRAITSAGVSPWSNVVGVTTVANPGSTPGTGAMCPDPGSLQFLYGKSWVSDFTQAGNNLPVRWEVSVDANNQLTYRVTCRMSLLGWGADLSPQITVPIGSVTGSSFQVLSPGTQRLTNAQGNYCEVTLNASILSYTPRTSATMTFQGQNFVTGACSGGSGSDGGGGTDGGVYLPGVGNCRIGTRLNSTNVYDYPTVPFQYHDVGSKVYVYGVAGGIVSIPYTSIAGTGNIQTRQFEGSGSAGLTRISLSSTPGGGATAACTSNSGGTVILDAEHCIPPSTGYVNFSTTCGSVWSCMFAILPVGIDITSDPHAGASCPAPTVGTGTTASCSAGAPGDPRTGTWRPSARVTVGDPTGGLVQSNVTYVPGCLNPDPSQTIVSCGQNSSGAAMASGDVVSVRYRVGASYTQGQYFSFNSGGGSGISYPIDVSLSLSPGDFSPTDADCETSGVQISAPRIVIGDGAGQCHLMTNSLYYLNLRIRESCSGPSCVFKINEPLSMKGTTVNCTAGSGSSSGSGTGTTSGSGSVSGTGTNSTPAFPWTIHGATYTSLAAVQAAFAPNCVNVNGSVVVHGFGPCISGTAP